MRLNILLLLILSTIFVNCSDSDNKNKSNNNGSPNNLEESSTNLSTEEIKEIADSIAKKKVRLNLTLDFSKAEVKPGKYDFVGSTKQSYVDYIFTYLENKLVKSDDVNEHEQYCSIYIRTNKSSDKSGLVVTAGTEFEYVGQGTSNVASTTNGHDEQTYWIDFYYQVGLFQVVNLKCQNITNSEDITKHMGPVLSFFDK